MGIHFDETCKTFHLKTSDTSYVMKILKDKYLVHLYWGRRLRDNNLDYLLRPIERPFSPFPNPIDKSYSLDTLPVEYPTYGNSDFRIPAFSVLLDNGTTVVDLSYKTHQIIQGKPRLAGLPATYVQDDSEAETLEIELADDPTGLRVVLLYTVFRDFNAITRSVRIINEGPDKLKLLRAFSANVDFQRSDFHLLQLSGAWGRERHLRRRKPAPGLQAIESRRGASSHQQNPFFALLSEEAGEESGDVYGFSLVYSGNFIAGVEVDQFDTSRAFIGINPHDFTWLLEPMESFQAPEVVLVHSHDGIDSLSHTYHQLYRRRLSRGKYRDLVRPVPVNTWEATYFNFDADRILDIAEIAKELGIELLVLDDGWFGRRDDDSSSLGDWFVNTEKLSAGLADLAEGINRLGMKFGLWVEPEMISPDSQLYRAHPDWCIHVPNRTRSESRNQLVLDFSRPEVCSAVIQMISEILRNAPISYVKWDCNRHLTEIGSAMLPPERQRETLHRHILGVYRVMDEITSSFPDVLFESCSGGGGRFDPGMLYYMPQVWTSDSTDAVERLKIQYGTSIVYPPSSMCCHVSVIPNHQVHRNTSLKMRGDVASSGVLGYQLDLTKLTPEEKEYTKKQIELYKELRKLILFGRMHRLKSPFTSNEAAWIFVSEDHKEAFMAYFRILAIPNEPLARIFPRGLNPAFTYELIDEDMALSGDALMYAGLPIPLLKGDFQSYTWRMKAR